MGVVPVVSMRVSAISTRSTSRSLLEDFEVVIQGEWMLHPWYRVHRRPVRMPKP